MARKSRTVAAKVTASNSPAELKTDGWANAFTGLGVRGYDKRLGGDFFLELLSQENCEQIWRGDHMAAKAVEKIPDEALREGVCVRVEGDKDLSEQMDAILRDEIDVLEITRTAWNYSRALGGSGAVLGVDDGQRDLSKPLNQDAVRTFDWVNVLTPRELVPVDWYDDFSQPKYGQVETYRITPIDSVPGSQAESAWPIIHESRILKFPGVRTTLRASLRNPAHPGWEDPIFVRIVQIINSYSDAFASMGILITDFAPPVLKMVGLGRLLASQNPSEAAKSIQARAAGIERSKSNARAVIIDEKEEYKRETVSVTGLPELIDRMREEVASALDMPVTVLMGQAPAGLNATGDADIRIFYDRVASLQRQKAKPFIKRIVQLKFLAKDGPTGGKEPENWDIYFPPLWQLTDLEKANVRYLQAQTDQIYVNTQVLIPEEVTESRFGGDEYSTDTHVDMEARKALREEQVARNQEMGAQGLNPDGTPNVKVQALQAGAQAAAAQAVDKGAPGGDQASRPLDKGK